MSTQILSILKSKLRELSASEVIDVETQRNALKEELQYYVLSFIYHHPQYGKWIMYGGSALRICHDLNRMSVDLDFEIADQVSEEYLSKLKKEIEVHFANTYGTDSDFLAIKITNRRGLILKFNVGEELSFGHASKLVQVKIDLNYFIPTKTMTERWPINRGQLSFVITTYTMSTLMASKIAAIFLRGTRGVGEVVYEEKGRDIYDLLWYMGKKIVPDIDYLIAKGVDVKDPKVFFDKLTMQMNKVSDENLKLDLNPLFVDQRYIDNWLKNWRESYFRLLDAYKIYTVTMLESGEVHQSNTSTRISFVYVYQAEDLNTVQFEYTISDRWLKFPEGDIVIKIDQDVIAIFGGNSVKLSDKLKRYITLFYDKTEKYLNKRNRIMIGDSITTKVIRMTADNLNQKEQIVLDRSAILSCELDDLVK